MGQKVNCRRVQDMQPKPFEGLGPYISAILPEPCRTDLMARGTNIWKATTFIVRYILRAYGVTLPTSYGTTGKGTKRPAGEGGIMTKHEYGFIPGACIELDIASAYPSAAASIPDEITNAMPGALAVKRIMVAWITQRERATADTRCEDAKGFKRCANSFIGVLSFILPDVRNYIVTYVNSYIRSLIQIVEDSDRLRVVQVISDSIIVTVSQARQACGDINMQAADISDILDKVGAIGMGRLSLGVASSQRCMLVLPAYQVGIRMAPAHLTLSVQQRGIPKDLIDSKNEMVRNMTNLLLLRGIRIHGDVCPCYKLAAGAEHWKCIKTDGLLSVDSYCDLLDGLQTHHHADMSESEQKKYDKLKRYLSYSSECPDPPRVHDECLLCGHPYYGACPNGCVDFLSCDIFK